jgi:hypothetical protein
MTSAQSGDNYWTSPERLSSEDGMASQPYMVSDQYGYVHMFWSESGSADEGPVIRYSRYDGETWSLPNDIFITAPDAVVVFISPFVDSKGMLHLLWSENNTGPMMYSLAPAGMMRYLQGTGNILSRSMYLRSGESWWLIRKACCTSSILTIMETFRVSIMSAQKTGETHG